MQGSWEGLRVRGGVRGNLEGLPRRVLFRPSLVAAVRSSPAHAGHRRPVYSSSRARVRWPALVPAFTPAASVVASISNVATASTQPAGRVRLGPRTRLLHLRRSSVPPRPVLSRVPSTAGPVVLLCRIPHRPCRSNPARFEHGAHRPPRLPAPQQRPRGIRRVRHQPRRRRVRIVRDARAFGRRVGGESTSASARWGGAGRGWGWQLLRTVLDQEAIERIERIILERAIKVPATTLTTHGPPPPL